MPLALNGRPKDAVAVLPPGAAWRDGVAAFLATLTADRARVERHHAVLDARADGSLRWSEAFADAQLPNGRPMPASRRYSETLVTEERLPSATSAGCACPWISTTRTTSPASPAGIPIAWKSASSRSFDTSTI